MAPRHKWTGREQKIAYVLVVVALAALFLQFGLPWLSGDVESVKDQIEIAQEKMERHRRFVQDAREARREYQPLWAQYKQKDSPEEIMSKMLSDIQAVSARISVPITDMKPDRLRTVDSFNHFSVSMSLEGRLTDILHFIHIMQGPPYQYFLDELTLRREYFKAEKLRCQLVFKQILIP